MAQDMMRAVELYEAAAAQGDARAQANLAVFYRKGEVVAQDTRRAMELWEAAAAQGEADAQFNLAVCYQATSVPKPKPNRNRHPTCNRTVTVTVSTCMMSRCWDDPNK